MLIRYYRYRIHQKPSLTLTIHYTNYIISTILLLQVHGGWVNWSGWSECSVTCGDGNRSRSRTCTNPVPSSDGRQCIGAPKVSKSCNIKPCPSKLNVFVFVSKYFKYSEKKRYSRIQSINIVYGTSSTCVCAVFNTNAKYLYMFAYN